MRKGLQALQNRGDEPRTPFRQRTVSLGHPTVDLTKALQLSTALEDEEIRRELDQRK
ncbi:hypothetical protein D3C83_120630 [compost metagenome]